MSVAVPPPSRFRVTERRRDTHDTCTLVLEPLGEAPVGRFAPGQFAMLYAFGAGEVPISLCGGGDGRLVHTIRAVGAVTERLCALGEGDEVGVRGPYGTTWPLVEAAGRDVVVITGGLGLPPLRPVIEALLEDRDSFGELNLLYGGRSPGELLFQPELEGWRARFDMTVEVIVDSAPAGWHGRVGVVTKLIPRASFDPANTVAMMCGPEVMMRFAVAALRDRGVPPESIWVSLERSMKCAVGHCGHCQLGPLFVCRDGPVVRHDVAGPLMAVREL
jgi:anaerobic sulfite reductase subunit B